jgi:hypothetical protein
MHKCKTIFFNVVFNELYLQTFRNLHSTEVVCTVRLLFDYLLDFPIAIHSRVFVLDLAGDIDLEKPKS